MIKYHEAKCRCCSCNRGASWMETRAATKQRKGGKKHKGLPRHANCSSLTRTSPNARTQRCLAPPILYFHSGATNLATCTLLYPLHQSAHARPLSRTELHRGAAAFSRSTAKQFCRPERLGAHLHHQHHHSFSKHPHQQSLLCSVLLDRQHVRADPQQEAGLDIRSVSCPLYPTTASRRGLVIIEEYHTFFRW